MTEDDRFPDSIDKPREVRPVRAQLVREDDEAILTPVSDEEYRAWVEEEQARWAEGSTGVGRPIPGGVAANPAPGDSRQ